MSERAEHELLVEIHNVAIPDDPVDVEDYLGFLRSCREHASFLALDGERHVGAAVGAVEPQRVTPYLHLWVAPDERRHGVGSELYRAVSAWCTEQSHRELEVSVRDDDSESLVFARRRGFAPFRGERGLVLELTALEPPPVEPPAGVEIVTWAERPELARAIYEVAAEALPDIAGEEDPTIEPFEDWLEHDMRGRGDRPEATFVALAGDEVVGYAKFSLTDAQPAPRTTTSRP